MGMDYILLGIGWLVLGLLTILTVTLVGLIFYALYVLITGGKR
jgi:hypothetical protein